MAEPKSYFCPAKLNLFLAVTGRGDDGFHTLVSVVAPLSWGDTLEVTSAEKGSYSLTCDDPEVPIEGNLVLQAARVYATETGWAGGARFHLRKRVPMGAGLGGGSSDGAMALRALNALAGEPLDKEALQRLAARIGSDCPLFLENGPVIMRGRGERLTALPTHAIDRLVGRRVLVIKPPFSINTAWAYRTLAGSAPASYLPDVEAEARLRAWLDDPARPVEALGFNSLERPAFAKFMALPVMLRQLRERHGLTARMSGSGSACYTFVTDDTDIAAIRAMVMEGWGTASLCEAATIWQSAT